MSAPMKNTAQGAAPVKAGSAEAAGPAMASGMRDVGEVLSEVLASRVKREGLSGEERAQEEVNVRTVAETKADLDKGQEVLTQELQGKVDDIFAMASGEVTPPEGTTVESISDQEAVLVRTDPDGNVLERTVARRDTDVARLSLDSASYENGVNTRDHAEILQAGGTRVRHADYPSETNDAQALKPMEDFNTSCDPDLTYTDSWLKRDQPGGEVLSLSEYTQSGGGVTGSDTEFTREGNAGLLDDKLKDQSFDFDKPIDQATTYSYSIPAPGTKTADGTQEARPSYQRVLRFSQTGEHGDIQATAFNDKEFGEEEHFHEGEWLDGVEYFDDAHTAHYAQAVGTGPHNREQLDNLRREHQASGWEEHFDNDNVDPSLGTQVPKRWLVEMNTDENTYRSQTFIEGGPKATLVTERKRDGNTVRENYGGQMYAPGSSDLVYVGGESSKRYAEDGTVEEMHSKRHDPDGSQTEQSYASRILKRGGNGILQGERTESIYTDPEGKKTTSLQMDASVLSKNGVQLLSTQNTVTDEEGRQAVSSLNSEGEKLTLSGPGGADPRDITDSAGFAPGSSEELLLLAAGTTTATTLKSFADNGGAKALDAVKDYLKGHYDATEALPRPQTLDTVLGQERLKTHIDQVANAKSGFGALGGALGAVAAGFTLAEGLRGDNKGSIALGALGVAGAGMDLTEAALKSPTLGRWLSNALSAPSGSSAASTAVGNTLSKVNVLGKIAGVGGALLGAGVGVGAGIMDIIHGTREGHTGQVARGAVDIVGSLAGVAAGLALSGPAGFVVGGAIGLGTLFIGGLIDLFSDDEHKISELNINDSGFSVPTMPPPPEPEVPAEEPWEGLDEDYWPEGVPI